MPLSASGGYGGDSPSQSRLPRLQPATATRATQIDDDIPEKQDKQATRVEETFVLAKDLPSSRSNACGLPEACLGGDGWKSEEALAEGQAGFAWRQLGEDETIVTAESAATLKANSEAKAASERRPATAC